MISGHSHRRDCSCWQASLPSSQGGPAVRPQNSPMRRVTCESIVFDVRATLRTRCQSTRSHWHGSLQARCCTNMKWPPARATMRFAAALVCVSAAAARGSLVGPASPLAPTMVDHPIAGPESAVYLDGNEWVASADAVNPLHGKDINNATVCTALIHVHAHTRRVHSHLRIPHEHARAVSSMHSSARLVRCMTANLWCARHDFPNSLSLSLLPMDEVPPLLVWAETQWPLPHNRTPPL
jgi:hypothetical protein